MRHGRGALTEERIWWGLDMAEVSFYMRAFRELNQAEWGGKDETVDDDWIELLETIEMVMKEKYNTPVLAAQIDEAELEGF